MHDFPTMGSWGHAPLTMNLDQNLVEGFDLLKDGPQQKWWILLDFRKQLLWILDSIWLDDGCFC